MAGPRRYRAAPPRPCQAKNRVPDVPGVSFRRHRRERLESGSIASPRPGGRAGAGSPPGDGVVKPSRAEYRHEPPEGGSFGIIAPELHAAVSYAAMSDLTGAPPLGRPRDHGRPGHRSPASSIVSCTRVQVGGRPACAALPTRCRARQCRDRLPADCEDATWRMSPVRVTSGTERPAAGQGRVGSNDGARMARSTGRASLSEPAAYAAPSSSVYFELGVVRE
jgi:hypothetical protein